MWRFLETFSNWGISLEVFATSAPRELRCALGDKPTLCQANAGDFE